MKNEIIPANDLSNMVANIRAASKDISYHGLTRKQKRFCLAYAGDKIEAVKAAGYIYKSKGDTYRLIHALMDNTQVRINIKIVDKMLAKYCVANALEIKMQLSERLRSDDLTDGNRVAFSKIMLQTQGELSERLMIDQNLKQNNNINIIIADSTPNQSELTEYKRLEQAIEDQTNAELVSMGRQPCISSSTCLPLSKNHSQGAIDNDSTMDPREFMI